MVPVCMWEGVFMWELGVMLWLHRGTCSSKKLGSIVYMHNL